MIYLTTGANGAGKTLCVLQDVRAQQLKEVRPVFYNGFEMDEATRLEFGWQKFDPRKWQDLPDGSICVMDECQNEFPARGGHAPVPDYINAVAQFRRKRGFDFWMIAPHPMLIDSFIRKLVDTPSWHRHLKRSSMGDMVSVIKWTAVNVQCEKAGSGASGEISLRRFPKEVYGWYQSASMHTAKPRIPRAYLVLAACVLAVPALGYFAANRILAPGAASAAAAATAAAGKTVPPAGGAGAPSPARQVTSSGAASLTAADYMIARTPRIDGFPQTAPIFDAVTQPQQAPYPAACIAGRRPGRKADVCECWTQQGTKLSTPLDMCRQIASQGFFMEWAPAGRNGALQGPNPQQTPQVQTQPAAAASGGAMALPSAVLVDSNVSERDGSNIGAIRANALRRSKS